MIVVVILVLIYFILILSFLLSLYSNSLGKFFLLRCDVCVNGPPNKQDLKEEANILMQIIAARYVSVCVIMFNFFFFTVLHFITVTS